MNSHAQSAAGSLSAPEYILRNFDPDDRIAVLIRNSVIGKTTQRISTAESKSFLIPEMQWRQHGNCD